MPEYIEKSAVINALIDVENRYNRNRDHENVSAEALYKDLCNAEIEIGKQFAADVAPVVLPSKVGDTDYTGLVEELRALSKHVPEQVCDDDGRDPLERAADAIETLLAEWDALMDLEDPQP